MRQVPREAVEQEPSLTCAGLTEPLPHQFVDQCIRHEVPGRDTLARGVAQGRPEPDGVSEQGARRDVGEAERGTSGATGFPSRIPVGPR